MSQAYEIGLSCLYVVNKYPKAINAPVLKEMSCLYTSVRLKVCVSFAD